VSTAYLSDALAVWMELVNAHFFDGLVPVAAGLLIKSDLTTHLSWFRDHVHDGFGGDGFTAAAFPDDSQGLPAVDDKTGTVHRVDDPIANIEFHMEIVYSH
jgi:hypothetical protein